MQHKIITPQQSKAARGLLEWKQRDLAECSSVSLGTIINFEGSKRPITPGNLKLIYEAFENAGIEFIADGVRKRP